MDNDNRHNSNNNNNNYKRRSSRYNKNYKGSSKKNYSNYKNNNKHRNENYQKNSEDNMDFNITKQQVFDFDEMKFSDEIDTSFVENKRKKKEQIVDELTQSYEKRKVQQQKREKKHHSKIHVGRLFAFIAILVLLLALLIVCFYILTKPVDTKVVTKEKEVVVMDDNYLFLGDSITEQYDLDEYFPDMNVVNSGISGNKTKDLLNDLNNRVYQYNPSKVFLLIGTNDIQSKVEDDVIINNIKKILEDIHENRPYAKLYLEAIYPVDEGSSGAQDRTNKEIQSINASLEDYCKKNDITFIDMYDLLLDPESDKDRLFEDYSKDGLHISDEGYEVITEEIMKYIK